jgi:molecular chaperone DnaK
MNSAEPPAARDEQPPVGIDLGTTYSALACLDPTGRPVTIPNGSGDLLTPSAVFIDGDEIVVGKEAVKSAALSPAEYIECFKRDMGSVVAHRKLGRRDVPPEVLSAFVLERLKQDAEQRLGPIRKAVITVPAFFDETRRRATQDAGRLAGLEVLDIINEPTAAAVAYGHDRGFFDPSRPAVSAEPQRVLVYDLGGGTFDVTILEISGTRFRTVATDGDVRLGGKDFDERLVDHLARQFAAAHGVDPRSDPQDAAQLWMDAMEAKHALSERSKTMVVCFHAGVRMRMEVTRQEFEDLIRDLVERTETTASLVVRQAGLDWTRIDRVLLVGGSSRIPMVSQMLERLTGQQPDRSQSPDEAVAHGAALYAGMLMARGSSGKPACELVNVNSHSLGVVGVHRKTGEKTNVVLIPKNTPLPARAVRTFKTARAGQRTVKVAVVEGESHRPEDCIALGECIVRGLPPDLPRGTPIEVEYRYAADGCIAVSARVPSVRCSTQVEISRDQGRNLDDLKTWRARLCGQEAWPAGGSVSSDGAAVDPSDPGSVLKRLDALYAAVGRAAVSLTLPESLARSQQAAMTAVREYARTRARFEEAENARRSVPAGAEAIRLDAELVQARTALEQAQRRRDFAHLVLGRECAGAGFYPPGTGREIEEIRRLAY